MEIQTAHRKYSGQHFTEKGYLNLGFRRMNGVYHKGQGEVCIQSRWTAELEVPTIALLQDLLGRDVLSD